MSMNINGVLIMILIAQNSFSQTFKLPDIPKYDSIFIDSYKDKVLEKTYFLEGKRVFEIGYNTGSMFYTPFAHIGGGKEDSCYAYFNGINHDQSGYYPYKKPRPEQPGGYSLLKQSDKEIYFVDLSYYIILGAERFNVIQFRVSNKGEFLGKTYFPSFATKYFYLTQGLDSLNTGKFHKSIMNWEKIAENKGFDITSRDFNERFEFKPINDYYGELRMVLEQISETKSTRHSFSNKLRQFIINPWTGEMK